LVFHVTRPKSSIHFGIILILVTLFYTKSAAQFEHKLFSRNLWFEAKAYYGFLYAQHLELEIFNAHFPAFEISIQQQTYGKHKWERHYDYPLIGCAAFYSGIGNNPSLGYTVALMPFVNFPVYRKDNFSVGFRLALGIGYISNPFDRLSNYKNLAIGSHLNAAVNLSGEIRYQVNYMLTVSAGVGLQHFSNGSLKLPNYGINMPLANVGLAYSPFQKNKNLYNRYIAPTEPYSCIVRNSMDLSFGGFVGFKNMEAIYGENYWVSHFYGNLFFPVTPKSNFGAGFDVSYDPSHKTKLEKSGVEVDNPLKLLRPGINGAYKLWVSDLSVLLNLGYYLGGMETSNGPFYEKISLQYNFSKEFFAAVMLKVHWGRADYIGWGIGYNFNIVYGKRTVR
jgi:hypothetical protein